MRKYILISLCLFGLANNTYAQCKTSGSTTITACDSYEWSLPVGDGAIYTLSGTYTHTTLNASGCIHTQTLHVTVSSNDFNLTVAQDQPISCHGANDGSLHASISSGVPVTFTCVNPTAPAISNTTGDFPLLEVGTHTIYVTDGICTSSATYTFIEPDPLDIMFETDSLVSCLGNDGELSITISGGTSLVQPFLTWWTNAQGDTLNDVFTNNYAMEVWDLVPGIYQVTVEDDNGCIYSESSTIGYAPSISVNAIADPIVCHGGTSSITCIGTGGVSYAPFYNSTLTYLVNNLPIVAAYPAGTYTITAMDAKGCTGTTLITINEPALITAELNEVGCNSYIWNGSTYTASGDYSSNFIATNGCDSVVTMHLIIHSSTQQIINVTACDAYIWYGNTYTIDGIYTHTSLNAQNCEHTEILNLSLNYSTTSTANVMACNTYTWILNGVTYTTSGTYITNTLNAAGCNEVATLELTMNSGVTLSAKALLDGAYDANTGLMKDSLRQLTHCATSQTGVAGICPPVNVIPHKRLKWFNTVNGGQDADTMIGGGNVLIAGDILTVTGQNAIVDWVFVELRDGINSGNIVATKYALIQRDGDIVSCIDGISPLFFSNICPGTYFISIKHRNHLGVMTGSPVSLSASATTIDFSNPATLIWLKPGYPSIYITNPPRHIVGSKALLWGGDANTNKNSKYNGLDNDKERISYDVGLADINRTIYQTYRNTDLNMDGKVRYNNTDNDRNWLLSLIQLSSTPSSSNYVITQHTPN